MNKTIALGYLGLAALFASAPTQAQLTNFYAGASWLDTEPEWMATTDSDTGFEARLGYMLNPVMALEASYLDIGTVNLPQFPDAGGSAETDAYSVSGLLLFPIGNLSVFGKLGYLWSETDGEYGTIAGPRAANSEESEVLLGAGLSFEITDAVELRLEYNESDHFNWAGLGLNLHF